VGETDYIRPIGDEDSVRLRVRIQTGGGAITRFAIQLEFLRDGAWCEVVRYDNAHGSFHRDEYDVRGRVSKRDLDLPDARTTVEYAEQDLIDRWEWYLQRFLHPLRRRRNP
jgi:hypothetical protein